MIIPPDSLAPDTLLSLIESFVLREGTDYGEAEMTTGDKVAEVMMQIERGDAFILYSELHDSVNIVSRETLDKMKGEEAEDSAP